VNGQSKSFIAIYSNLITLTSFFGRISPPSGKIHPKGVALALVSIG
jgi:hypothetical protein